MQGYRVRFARPSIETTVFLGGENHGSVVARAQRRARHDAGAGIVAGGRIAQAPAAHAYGRLAQYQVGLSFNCNNTTYCGSQLGGFWGWAEFDSDNTADAQLTGCQHFKGGGAAGAQHFSSDAQGGTSDRMVISLS